MTTNNNNLDRLGARIYGRDDATEADTRGGRVYGRGTSLDRLGARVYGLGDRGAVSYEQATDNDTATADDDTATPERWRLNEVRKVADVGSYDDLDAIGERIYGWHSSGDVVVIDSWRGLNDTPGLPGFDY